MEPYIYTKVETRLANLLTSRRLRFPYIDSETGEFRWNHFWWIVLNVLASCLNIPLLFYMSFYIFLTYPGLNLKPLDMLSVIFFSAASSLLFDAFIGYIYDKLIKPDNKERPSTATKAFLSILGTIGLIVSTLFFFRTNIDQAEAATQFRITLLLSMFFMAFTNCTNFKNTIYYSPSQEDRRVLHHLEYFLKGFFIFCFVSAPLWAKFWTSDCSCGQTCKDNPASTACTGCIDTCDKFAGKDLSNFQTNAIVWTCIFGLANILVQCLIRTRKDEDREDIPTTLNRRLVEIYTNRILLKSFMVSVFEYSILFGFAIWSYYYISQEITISQVCLERWGSSSYLCTRSFWLQMTVFLMFLISSYTFIISVYWSFILFLSIGSTILAFIAGLLILVIPSSDTTMFCFIAIFMACFFGTLAGNKLVYTDGIYYDEYKSGVAHPNLPSSLFILSVKLGFLIAMALHLTLINPEGIATDKARNYNQKGFGSYVMFASFILFILKLVLNKNNLHAFDKIQVAIERNVNLQKDDIAFYDPVAREPVRCPVTSFHTLEKKLIRLMYNFRPSEMHNVINGKQRKVQDRALIKLFIHLFFAILFTVLITVFGSYFDTPWAWLMAIGLIYIPIALLAILYEYNVWAAAGSLDHPRFKGVDRNVLLRFAIFLEGTKCEDFIRNRNNCLSVYKDDRT